MELRMMAHLSNASSMITAYEEGIDVHLKTASDLNNLPLDKVTKDMRQGAKAVNFGLIYGKTDYGYAIDWYSHEPDFWVDSTWSPSGKEPAKKYLEMTRQFLRKFFDANPAVEEYMKAKQDQAGRNGYVRSITGRKRRLPGIFSESASERNRAKRQSVNSIDQGSSADYLKIAMNKMEDRATDLDGDFPCYQLLTVHDEIINLVRKKDAERCRPIMVELMTTAVPLRCPIETDPTVAYKYGSAK
jgi:DNA polymerase I